MRGARRVVHLAANADVRFGLSHPRKDLEQNTIATFNVLEAMRANNVREIAFSSTGSVYGEAAVVPTPEDAPFPVQTSLYGASKLACEGMIAAYAEGYGIRARIFRFVSILGQRYSHGHIFDFMMQLAKNRDTLHVLGDGKQRKSYLHVDDCIEAMLLAFNAGDEHIEIINLGTDEVCQVVDSVGWIVKRLGLSRARGILGC
jgi:UDP-glucose 4-epimerase